MRYDQGIVMIFIPFLHLIVLLANVYLAGLVLYKDPKSVLNKTCAALLLCFSLWNSNEIFSFNPGTLAHNISSFGWIGFASALFCFSLAFSKKEKLLKNKLVLFIIFIIPSILIYKQWTNCLTIDYFMDPSGIEYRFSNTIWPSIYFAYYGFATVLSLGIIYRHGKKTKKLKEKKQARIIVIAGAALLFLGTMFGVVIPGLDIHGFPALASIVVMIFPLAVVYAIVKYRFLTITPATAADNILLTMEEFLILLDSDGGILDLNRTAIDSLGFKKNELMGKSVSVLLQEDAAHAYLLEKIVAGNVLKNYELVLRGKAGKEIPVMFSSSPLKNEEGEISGIVFVARDISDRKEAEKEKAKFQEQLFQTEKLSAIGQLAGGIAHDFNNMIGAIRGFAELIKMKTRDKDPVVSKYAKMIMEASTRASDLTSKLLAFARKGKYEMVAVDMHALIDEVIKMLEHTIDKRIQIRTCLEARTAIVQGDPTQLQNALLNLALNARDFMPDGGIITFSSAMARGDEHIVRLLGDAATRKKFLIVSVSDTGVGMEEHVKKKIFEPFFTTKPVGKGTGLGLASVYGTVTNHGGCIDVVSTVGAGAQFHMYLPLSEDSAILAPPPTKCITIEKGIGKILVIDDEEIIREMASEILMELGYSIVECVDGEEAVEYYTGHFQEIDLVLLDIGLPKMGGHECFTRLKKLNPLAKVVVFSGYSIDGEAQRILDQGALAFIQKPFDMQEMVDVIGKLKT